MQMFIRIFLRILSVATSVYPHVSILPPATNNKCSCLRSVLFSVRGTINTHDSCYFPSAIQTLTLLTLTLNPNPNHNHYPQTRWRNIAWSRSNYPSLGTKNIICGCLPCIFACCQPLLLSWSWSQLLSHLEIAYSQSLSWGLLCCCWSWNHRSSSLYFTCFVVCKWLLEACIR